MNRQNALVQIEKNITVCGQHIYAVSGGPSPRFAYSIGLSQDIGFELILAGAYYYSNNEVGEIINTAAKVLRRNLDRIPNELNLDAQGSFFFRVSDASWNEALILGAIDYYNSIDIPCYQIYPDLMHCTIDVPDLSRPWNPVLEPIWQWLKLPWSYPISNKTLVVTNLDALRGRQITETMRWEETEWELFADSSSDLSRDQIRIVPFATLLSNDSSLEKVIDIPVGEGLWRVSGTLDWQHWTQSGKEEGPGTFSAGQEHRL